MLVDATVSLVGIAFYRRFIKMPSPLLWPMLALPAFGIYVGQSLFRTPKTWRWYLMIGHMILNGLYLAVLLLLAALAGAGGAMIG